VGVRFPATRGRFTDTTRSGRERYFALPAAKGKKLLNLSNINIVPQRDFAAFVAPALVIIQSQTNSNTG
jgi:hypothetical protein